MDLTQAPPPGRYTSPAPFTSPAPWPSREFVRAMEAEAESAPVRSTRVGRHAPARKLRRWTAFLPAIVAVLAAAGGAFSVGLRELREGLWLSVSTSGVAAAALCIVAALLFLQMLDRVADQKAARQETASTGTGSAADDDSRQG